LPNIAIISGGENEILNMRSNNGTDECTGSLKEKDHYLDPGVEGRILAWTLKRV
jgi:hypothetical protein